LEKLTDESLQTQAETNNIAENSELDLVGGYPQLFSPLFFAAIYANIMPVSIVAAILNVFLNYAVDKYLLTKHTTISKELEINITVALYTCFWFLLSFPLLDISYMQLYCLF